MTITDRQAEPAGEQRARETDRVLAVYEREAHKYDRQMRFFERVLFRGGREWVCRRAVGDVLEIAVGTGLNLPHYPPGVRLTGIELSPAMLDIARARARELGREADLRVGDAQALDFPNESFDTVVCTLSLCTIPDDRAGVAEARRVLRPGGRFLSLEHVRSPLMPVRLGQRLLDPLFFRLEADHLLREPLDHLRAESFEVELLELSKLGIVERVEAHKPQRAGAAYIRSVPRTAARRAALLALTAALLAAGCGSSTSTTTTTKPEAGSIAALAREQGPSVELVPGDSDFAPGPIRYSFLVIAKDGRIVDRPTARVFTARNRNEQPFQRATARREPVGVPGLSEPPFGVRSIYVVHLRVRTSGRYWVAALPTRAKVGALGTIDVRAQAFSPAIGALAPRSRTPTLRSTHGNPSPLTTAAHPNRALYTTSVARALASHTPFVLVFATPKFCESRTCGPVVDVVSSVQKKFEQSDVRFIHVEVYEDNDPSKGYNRWMQEWNLQTEPWVFLVGRDGRVKTKFEGSLSADELRRAVAELLSKG